MLTMLQQSTRTQRCSAALALEKRGLQRSRPRGSAVPHDSGGTEGGAGSQQSSQSEGAGVAVQMHDDALGLL